MTKLTEDMVGPISPKALIFARYQLELESKLGFDLIDTILFMTDEMAEKLAQEVGEDKEYWMTAYQAWEDYRMKRARMDAPPSRLVKRCLRRRLEKRVGFTLDDLDEETTLEMAKKLEAELDVPYSFWFYAFKHWKEGDDDPLYR